MDKCIVIPVHGQLSYVHKCIESVFKKSDTETFVVVVDDGSDEDTTAYLKMFKYPYYLIRHETAQGFTKSVNDGMKFALNVRPDTECFCLLNSDTEIGTHDWYNKVLDALLHNCGVASVISNNANHQSVPYESNRFPNGMTLDEYADFLEKNVSDGFVFSPLPHGFCYFIPRNTLDKVGYLDEVNLPHYGSEDDYSIKCLDAGFQNVVITNVFVAHARCKSYTEEKRTELTQDTVPLLHSIHTPEKVFELWQKTVHSLDFEKKNIHDKLSRKPEQELKTGIVVTCFERPQELHITLDSLMKSDIPKDTTIIFINDASVDHRVQVQIDSFYKEGVNIMRWVNIKNEGIFTNLWMGFEYLFNNGFTFMCNLDSDAPVSADWLTKLQEVHEQQRPCFATGFNPQHPMFEELEKYDNCVQLSNIPGINIYFEKLLYQMVINALKLGLSWDWELGNQSRKNKIPIFATRPSVVEHIGKDSTLKHTCHVTSKENFEQRIGKDVLNNAVNMCD